MLGLTVAVASPAHADLVAVTSPTVIFNGPGTEYRTYIAFDESTKVYFAVWGRFQVGPCFGVFLNSAGAPLSAPFGISDGSAQCGWARISAGNGRFFVTYTKRTGGTDSAPIMSQIARFVTYNAAGSSFGPEIVVDGLGSVPSDAGTAYVPASDSFLVTYWRNPAFPQSFVRRVSPDGTMGDVFQLTDNSDGLSDPEISCDASTSHCLAIGFSWDTPHNFQGATWARLIDGTTGAPIAPMRLLDAGIRQEVQTTTFSAVNGVFLTAWVRGGNRVVGMTVDVNGNPAGQYSIRAGDGNVNSCAYGYGQLSDSLKYNAGSGTSAIGLVDWCGVGYVQELDGGGAPIASSFQAVTGLVTENNQPNIAPNVADAQFLYVHNYQHVAPRSRLYQATKGGGGGQPPPTSGPTPTGIDLSPTVAPNGSWFLAEGSANSSPNGFKTFYLIQNSNPVDVVVRVYYANDSGLAYAKLYTVPANSRKTLSLIAEIGAGNYGTVFQSTTVDPNCPGGHCDIDVERSMFWGPNLEGSTDSTATKAPGTGWFFAEGSRGGELFNNYYLLFNPTQNTVQVTGSYFRPWAGTQPTVIQYNIGPQQRLTIDANAIPDLANTDFSATFSSTSPIVVERAMYWGWGGSDNLWVGGHATMGANTPYYQWYFAEGNAASNFETFYLILNPNPFPMTVVADYMTEFQGLVTKYYQLEAGTRATIYLNGEFGNLGPTAARFYSPVGANFLAERSIYWGGRIEGTNTIGALQPAREWHMPEGSTMASFFTYEMVMNPNAFPLPIDVSVYVEGVGRFTLPDRPVVPAFSRLTLDMRAILAQLDALNGFQYKISASSFATRIAVPSGVDPGIGIVAEHAMYWNFVNPQIYWRSGGASLGIPYY